jgi:hypothetical protein
MRKKLEIAHVTTTADEHPLAFAIIIAIRVPVRARKTLTSQAEERSVKSPFPSDAHKITPTPERDIEMRRGCGYYTYSGTPGQCRTTGKRSMVIDILTFLFVRRGNDLGKFS